ncbi:phytoene desaturase family protein [Engelhardtia mirabilis]|uniref:Phytoene desaturase (Lycopene-forming) n=1 Tax=Engelhardtia mirabilis TaxID=2528011 RepID=A0A518BH86_9BACT|nr:Phytoene desaturase (lycopene-forming) [Planctomycetes bacterium Pla133]QDV00668.1 Phytoene desaturase (lycopene-forming) [Planctomycetes bacterium Pla86]
MAISEARAATPWIDRRAAAPAREADSIASGASDVVVLGGGMAGLATAARLQARGVSTVVLEAHATPGGCAGWFRRRGFTFDAGATTLVDFGPGGVGGELLDEIGLGAVDGEALPGYTAWLPDRTVDLDRDPDKWSETRLAAFGSSAGHRRFWETLDAIASTFWRVSRRGGSLPIHGLGDLARAARAVGVRESLRARYLTWTLGDLLRRHGLDADRPLRAFLGMLVEDTVHGRVDTAPLVNAALGITIRGAGLTRARGGMAGFWRRFVAHYHSLGGRLVTRCRVERVSAAGRSFVVDTSRGTFTARQVVSALPAELTARVASEPVARRLAPHLMRNSEAVGGAVVVYLGVPEAEVQGPRWTHHQLLHDYDAPLGMGNNMFVSVSAPGDLASAPAGHRVVMVSTHCELDAWEGLEPREYARAKKAAKERLIGLARRVYPDLARNPVVVETGTPRTFLRFVGRPRGAVGGYRLHLGNANLRAIPQDIGVPGFHLVGDTTWPGLGTVASVLGSRVAARNVLAELGSEVG